MNTNLFQVNLGVGNLPKHRIEEYAKAVDVVFKRLDHWGDFIIFPTRDTYHTEIIRLTNY